jgi:phosphoglycolate phosphatase-like HAD superfamily hydrolase
MKQGTPICVDFDGVAWSLVDSLGHLPGCPTWNGKRLSLKNCDSWNTVIDVWGEGTDVKFAFEKMDEARSVERLRHFGLFPNFASSINRLKARGLRPHILSHNSDVAIAGIEQYLREQGLDLPLIQAKPAEKIAWCLEHGSPVIVDDAPETIIAAQAAGLTPIAPRYLYNADAIDQTNCPYTDKGWPALEHLVLTALGI